MKISLKRALKLRKELEAVLVRAEAPVSVSVSLLVEGCVADPMPAVAAGGDALVKAAETQVELSRILADLRLRVARLNADVGVEETLAQAAHATRCAALFRKLAASPVVADAEQVKAEVAFSAQSLKAPERPGYGRPERTMAVSVVTPALKQWATDEHARWRRAIEAIEDARASKNAATTIEIADADAALLQQQGLL